MLSGYKHAPGRCVYRVYHHTATLKDSVTVTPDKHGERMELQVQRYYSHAWHPAGASRCSSLKSTSKDTVPRRLGTTGHYRVRVNYALTAAIADALSLHPVGGHHAVGMLLSTHRWPVP